MKLFESGTMRQAVWTAAEMTPEQLAERLRTPVRTGETLEEFRALPKDAQLRLKDVGGYLLGDLRDGVRRRANVISRSAVVLDIDNGAPEMHNSVRRTFRFTQIWHSTRKHDPEMGVYRYRIIIPLTRPVTPAEYECLARWMAACIGMPFFDKTTFDPARLMFWPSISWDGVYEHAYFDEGPLYNPDYHGKLPLSLPRDLWPRAEGEIPVNYDELRNQTLDDPRDKSGVIGAFCRVYDVPTAIAEFLSDVYKQEAGNRYTYTGGTSSQGAVVYDNTFLYSFHESDPARGHCRNAFDLVRIHKFGSIEAESMKRMLAFANTLTAVRAELIGLDFSGEMLHTVTAADLQRAAEEPEQPQPEQPQPEQTDAGAGAGAAWLAQLTMNKKGEYESTVRNIRIIFENDPRLHGVFGFNEFDRMNYIRRDTPWKLLSGKAESLRNVDFAYVRRYIGEVYGIWAPQKVDDAVLTACDSNRFHPVREYLDGLEWDGVPRIASLLPRVLGAEATEYTAAALRITLLGAVKRIYEPACKFDSVLMLSGRQGIGKSTFFSVLAGSWFSDTFVGVRGKEAFEQMLGRWIIEAPELTGMRQVEVEAVKAFFSKRVDMFRPAYGRTVEEYPRQCIFVGTTNDNSFLTDPTGGRRYMPVRVGINPVEVSVWSEEFRAMRDQVWAEAVAAYRAGESVLLPANIEVEADVKREEQYEVDTREGIIADFLESDVPENWESMKREEFELWNASPNKVPTGIKPSRVSIPYLWFVVLGLRMENMNTANTKPIYSIMRRLSGWEESHGLVTVPNYGRQRVFTRANRARE